MDLSSIIGILGGIGVVLYSFLTSNGNFLDIPSIIITVFGSFFSTMLAVKLQNLKTIPKIIKIAFTSNKIDKASLISDMVSYSEKARREGILALEETVDEISDPFLKKGLQMMVDGIDVEVLKNILYLELDEMEERHAGNSAIFQIWGDFAPAFGMLGTLVGLIEMLNNMGGDASVIGAGMAKALVTTLYGSIMANVVLLPIKKKLDLRNKDELLYKSMMIEGILAIQSGDSPRMLESKLLSFLPPKERKSQMDNE